MKTDIARNLLENLAELNTSLGEKDRKQLKVKQLTRMVERLDSFSDECEECQKRLIELNDYVREVRKHGGELDIKYYRNQVKGVLSHLQKGHKLVQEGYYTSLYMSLGTSFGLILGLSVFSNLALGISFGISIGLIIGASMDANAKKNGLTL